MMFIIKNTNKITSMKLNEIKVPTEFNFVKRFMKKIKDNPKVKISKAS